MKRLVMIGASGHGKVCAEIAELTGEYKEILFIDDNPDIKECLGYPVEHSENGYSDYIEGNTIFFVSIGNAKTRKRIQEEIITAGGSVATLVHPDAVISKSAKIGTGSAVMAGAVINAEVIIGEGAIINTCSSVDHDCKIGDYTHISVGSHICGTVTIGDACWVGAGSTVSNNLNIVAETVIGAGTVVVKDITECGTYVGVPANRLVK